MVEAHVARVVLLVIGEDDRPAVALGVEPPAMAVWPKVAWPTEPTERTTLSTPASTEEPRKLFISALVWP